MTQPAQISETVQRRVALPPLLSASARRRPKGVIHSLGGATMGTSWSVRFVADTALSIDRLRQSIEASLQRVIAQMSSWDATSVLSQFHRNEISTWCAIPPEMVRVVKTGLRIARESDGAYDFTLGRLVTLWGFGTSGPRITPPDTKDIDAIHPGCGWSRVELSPDNLKLSRQSDLHLDLSGIAKGFAVDLVAMALRAHGMTDYLVEIGGELSGRGVKPDGTPWWVEIDGRTETVSPVMIGLHELAVATSGSERSFSSNRKRYSHTLDPSTGRPIDNGMVSATVLHATCMEADAYATALMVMGAERAIRFADEKGLAVVIRYLDSTTTDITERVSRSFKAMLD